MDIYKERIKPLFENSGLTNAELEREIGIPPKTINKWNSGYVSSYTKYIAQIAKFFNVNPDYLLGETDIKNPISDKRDGVNKKFDKLTPEQQKMVEFLIDQLLASPPQE